MAQLRTTLALEEDEVAAPSVAPARQLSRHARCSVESHTGLALCRFISEDRVVLRFWASEYPDGICSFPDCCLISETLAKPVAAPFHIC